MWPLASFLYGHRSESPTDLRLLDVCEPQKLKKIAESHLGEVTFVKVNGTDPEFQPLFHEVGITAVPWFHLYVNGERMASMSASLNPERLHRFREEIATLKQLDHRSTAQEAAAVR